MFRNGINQQKVEFFVGHNESPNSLPHPPPPSPKVENKQSQPQEPDQSRSRAYSYLRPQSPATSRKRKENNNPSHNETVIVFDFVIVKSDRSARKQCQSKEFIKSQTKSWEKMKPRLVIRPPFAPSAAAALVHSEEMFELLFSRLMVCTLLFFLGQIFT